MANDPYIEQRVNEESSKITAESYQKVASLGGWSGGGRTLWAISIIGAVAGAAIGLAAPFFPMLVGVAMPALATIGASTAVFAATGMSFGFGGGLLLGRISGSNAAVAQEQEKRMKEWTARQIISQNPNAEIVPDAPKAPEPQKSSWQRFKDNYRTYVNPRVGLVFAAIAAVGGLLMAAAFLTAGGVAALPASGVFAIAPALETITGLSAAALAEPAVIASYFAGVMASFGALFSINFPKVTSAMTHFFGELSSGKLLGREWGPKEPEKIHSQTQLSYNQDVAIADGVMQDTASRQTPRQQPYASFQDLVAQQQSAADLGMKR